MNRISATKAVRSELHPCGAPPLILGRILQMRRTRHPKSRKSGWDAVATEPKKRIILKVRRRWGVTEATTAGEHANEGGLAMSNAKRIKANRRNARKSTGPKTPQGKMRSRMNALKHGLDAETLILPGESEAEDRDRLHAWAADSPPRDPLEASLLDQAVGLSWRLDRAERMYASHLAERIRRLQSDDYRRQQAEAEAAEAAAIGERLLAGPTPPRYNLAKIHARLTRMQEGFSARPTRRSSTCAAPRPGWPRSGWDCHSPRPIPRVPSCCSAAFDPRPPAVPGYWTDGPRYGRRSKPTPAGDPPSGWAPCDCWPSCRPTPSTTGSSARSTSAVSRWAPRTPRSSPTRPRRWPIASSLTSLSGWPAAAGADWPRRAERQPGTACWRWWMM